MWKVKKCQSQCFGCSDKEIIRDIVGAYFIG